MYNPLIISFIFYRSTTIYSERFYWKNYHFIILLDIFQCEIFFKHKTKWKIQLFVTQKIQLIDIFCYRLYSDSLRTHFPLEGNEDQFVAKKAQTKSVTLTERPMETFRSDLRQIVSSYARPISILLQFQFPARHYRCSQSHGVEDHEKSYSVPLVGRNQFHPNSSLLFATVIGFRSAAISAPFSPSTTNRPAAANIQPRFPTHC